jgi:hypothetical protein
VTCINVGPPLPQPVNAIPTEASNAKKRLNEDNNKFYARSTTLRLGDFAPLRLLLPKSHSQKKRANQRLARLMDDPLCD